MNLAIASPLSSAYSETFIRMQMQRLPCRLRIHGGPVASETMPGGPIAPLKSLSGIADVILECGLRGTRWEGPQRRELKRRLKSTGIEVVLANYGPTGVALLPICVDLQIPLVVHFHGYDAHMADVIARHEASYRQMGAAASAVIAVSHKMAQALASFGVPPDKIRVTRYGSDPRQFPEKNAFPDAPVFLGLGRFVDKKAPYLTVLAFQKVHNQLPNARLILGGDGILLEVTRNIVDSLGLGAAVQFPGVLTPEQASQFMGAATAFVQHSIVPASGPSQGDSEGTPVAVLEAMMTGLPVIATRHAGIGEVIEHERTGLLTPERDVEGMAEAMLRVARDARLARTLGQAARQEALAKYTADHYIHSLEQILASAIELRVG